MGGPLPGSHQRPPLHAPFYLTPSFSASPAPSTFSGACFFWTKHMFPLLRHTLLRSLIFLDSLAGPGPGEVLLSAPLTHCGRCG